MKKRKDGRYCKQIRIDGKVESFYGKTIAEVNRKILDYNEKSKKIKEIGEDFEKVALEWEKFHLTQIPYTTYKKCGQSAFKSIANHFNGLGMKAITPKDVDIYLKLIASRGYAQKTVATYKSILNQIFKFAVINGYTNDNPVASVSIPKNLPKKQRELPSTEEINVINSLHEGFGFLGYFLLYTGLRVSEALALTYADVNRAEKLITINKKIVYDGNTPILRNEAKTEAGTRKVILLDRLAELLPNKKQGLVFSNSSGGYYTKKQLSYGWDKVKKENNITLTLHQLRHPYVKPTTKKFYPFSKFNRRLFLCFSSGLCFCSVSRKAFNFSFSSGKRQPKLLLPCL